jgi:nucleotide-binding universal stress UspA family protein
MPISTMLVPVGLDPHEAKVLRYVGGLNVQSVRRVLVVTVVDDSGMEAPVVAAEVDRARERLAEWTAPLIADSPMQIETRVVTGDTSSAILALAQQADVDVICCATEGKSIVDAIFSGSVSEELFTSGKVRTMTVRYSLLDSVDDPVELARNFAQHLVVPTDFSASAMRAWLSAIERPQEAIGELIAVHVIPPGDENERRNANLLLNGLLDMAREHDVNARCQILEGEDPAQEVLDFLAALPASGVITGQHGRGSLRNTILGGLSMRLLREAPCPVVVQP